MDVDRADHGAQESEELEVRVRVVLRIEQVDTGVGRHRPVVVLARTVDAGERLLVQQGVEPVPRRDPLERLHDDHLVINGDIGVLENVREFVLTGGDLVVPRRDRNAQAVQLTLDLGHEGVHAVRDRAEVVVGETHQDSKKTVTSYLNSYEQTQGASGNAQ